MAAEAGAAVDALAFDERGRIDGIHRPAVHALQPDAFESCRHHFFSGAACSQRSWPSCVATRSSRASRLPSGGRLWQSAVLRESIPSPAASFWLKPELRVGFVHPFAASINSRFRSYDSCAARSTVRLEGG